MGAGNGSAEVVRVASFWQRGNERGKRGKTRRQNSKVRQNQKGCELETTQCLPQFPHLELT